MGALLVGSVCLYVASSPSYRDCIKHHVNIAIASLWVGMYPLLHSEHLNCRKGEMTREDRRDSRRGGDRIVFEGPQRESETGGKSLDDRIKDHQAERKQRDGDRRRRDGSPDRRSRRSERRLDDEDRYKRTCTVALNAATSSLTSHSQSGP